LIEFVRCTSGVSCKVLSTVSVMGFVKAIDEKGPYRLEGGRVVRGKSLVNTYRQMYESDVDTQRKHAKASKAKNAASADAMADAAADPGVELQRRKEEARLEAECEASRSASLNVLVPLLYAPLLPMLRIGLRNRVAPERLTQITLGVVGMALVHAGTVMFTDSSVAMRK